MHDDGLDFVYERMVHDNISGISGGFIFSMNAFNLKMCSIIFLKRSYQVFSRRLVID